MLAWTALFLWSCWVHISCALAIRAPREILSLQQPHFLSTPAEQMLESLAQDCATLGISSLDVYGDFDVNRTSSYLRQFEHEVAREFGKADAVFMPSGVMAQNIALLIHGNKSKHSFICHESSHLLLHEQEAHEHLLHMKPIVIATPPQRQANNNVVSYSRPMEFNDVTSALSKEDINDIGTLLLELPHRELGGTCTPWQEVVKMQDYCRSHGIKFHCDGARIFEATAGYNNIMSVKELAAPFDSLYISFYKGLGGLSGAMLLSTTEHCNEARIWLRRFGGNLYTLFPYAVSGWSGYRKNWVDPSMTFVEKQQKLARIIQLASNGQIHSCVSFHPSIPQVNMIHGFLCYSKQECMDALDSVENEYCIRVLSRIKDVDESEPAFQSGFRSKFELTIGNTNGAIDDEVYLKGWDAFASALVARNTN